ncbi:MAG: hypothetical protein LC725_10715, partial [Lentisphaerae bacterium]|nr:hypothetical protein [Lentisphaerota bacterium]
VKLATIHGVKGLEFRHVFVLWKEEREHGEVWIHPADGTPLYFNTRERAFLATLPQLGMWTDKNTNAEEQELHETANLLYVAATRAVNTLTWVIKADKDACLKGFGAKIHCAMQKPISGAQDNEFGKTCDYGKPAQKTEPDPSSSLDRRYLSGPVDQGDPDDIDADPALLSAEIEAGMERGLRIHSALASLTPDHELPDVLDIPSADRECLDEFLSNPKVAEILSRPGKKLCEQHISNKNSLGIVDLLIINDKLITLVDYKTGSPRSDLLCKYRRQIARYQEILKSFFGEERSIESYLMFVDDPEVVVV